MHITLTIKRKPILGLHILIWLLLFAFTTTCFAVSEKEAESASTEEMSEENLYGSGESANYESDLPGKYYSLIMSASILSFGLIVILMEVLIIVRSGKGVDAFAFKIISLTLIITGALYLMSAGYTEKQLTPIIGLLGTVAGYILGQNDKPADKV